MELQKNIKNTFLLFGLLLPYLLKAQTNYSTGTAKIGFFSSTPIEDIKAVSNKGVAVLVSKTGEIAFQVPIKSFQFERGLMQEHFNDNYMESDKYPVARFKGKINKDLDFNKNGEYNVSAMGNLSMHGVDKPRTINGKVIVKDGKVQLLSNFKVACADHNIKIPKLVMTKIAEVINVNIDATLNPITK
ncbi:YceI family protein [Desertivirga brevis]|uniref:YceI family protein n=1 Tax=Desertivirga brevis TaxID=2810310 RepID=UPI001A95FA6F|nr:YceI family protein [Pedobacter sp. SYSU D00873]